MHLVLLGVRPPDFEPRRAGHAVAQRAHLAAGDVEPVDVEELDVGDRPAVHLLQHLGRVGALDLVAVVHAVDLLAVGARGRARVAAELDVVLAERGVELDPVGGRRAADQDELGLGLAEDDHVADHVAVGRDRHEVLGAAGGEVGEAVDGEAFEQRWRRRALRRSARPCGGSGRTAPRCGARRAARRASSRTRRRRRDRRTCRSWSCAASPRRRRSRHLALQTGLCHALSSSLPFRAARDQECPRSWTAWDCNQTCTGGALRAAQGWASSQRLPRAAHRYGVRPQRAGLRRAPREAGTFRSSFASAAMPRSIAASSASE